MSETFIRNCVVIPKQGDDPFPRVNGLRVVQLDGYAVIPLNEYESLVNAAVKDTEFMRRVQSDAVGCTWHSPGSHERHHT